MAVGKVATAPCGHPGEHVIGSYVRCSSGCDSRATPRTPTPPPIDDDDFILEEDTPNLLKCPYCFSLNTSRLGFSVYTYHCWDCGKLW